MSKKFLIRCGFGLATVGIIFYQNCASNGGGESAFNLTNGSESPLTVSSISLSQNSIQPSAAFTATSAVVSQNQVTCQWVISTTANVAVTSATTQAVSGACSFSGIAPATIASYILTLTATDSANNTASSFVDFQVSTLPTATPTPPASCLVTGTACAYNGTSNCGSCCNPGYTPACYTIPSYPPYYSGGQYCYAVCD